MRIIQWCTSSVVSNIFSLFGEEATAHGWMPACCWYVCLKTNHDSLFISCHDSCYSETQLPGLFAVTFAVLHSLLPWSCISCFARSSSNQQFCLGVVCLDCLSVFTWNPSTRVTNMGTNKHEKYSDFSVNCQHSKEINFSLLFLSFIYPLMATVCYQ